MEAGSEFRIGAAGEPVTGGEPVSRQPGDRPAVDPLGQVVVLDLDLRLVEIDVPGAPRGAPAVAASLQEVFELLRCPFGPEPNGGLSGGLQQGRQRQRAGDLQRPGEQRQKGVAVVNRAVPAVEESVVG